MSRGLWILVAGAAVVAFVVVRRRSSSSSSAGDELASDTIRDPVKPRRNTRVRVDPTKPRKRPTATNTRDHRI